MCDIIDHPSIAMCQETPSWRTQRPLVMLFDPNTFLLLLLFLSVCRRPLFNDDDDDDDPFKMEEGGRLCPGDNFNIFVCVFFFFCPVRPIRAWCVQLMGSHNSPAGNQCSVTRRVVCILDEFKCLSCLCQLFRYVRLPYRFSCCLLCILIALFTIVRLVISSRTIPIGFDDLVKFGSAASLRGMTNGVASFKGPASSITVLKRMCLTQRWALT